MRPIIVGLAALAATAASMVLPGSPAAAAGTTYLFGTLAQSQHVAFDPAADLLRFDSAAIAAASVRLVDVIGNLGISAGGKTVYLDGVELRELSSANITFADGSALRVGDAQVGTRGDDLANLIDLTPSSKGNQIIGLGGADVLTGGSGTDRFVGSAVRPPLEHVSRVGATGAPTASSNPSVSADGNVVAFQGGWTQFGSTNDNGTDVFTKRIDSGSVSDEHRTSGGTNGGSGSGSAQLSASGRYVAFVSSSQLVGGSPPANTVYRSDTLTNDIVAVSTTAGGAFANGASGQPDISADGRYVTFTSAATNLATGSSGTTVDVFLKDMATGAIRRVSTSASLGDANADTANPHIAADGRFVVFSSSASNLDTTNTGGGHADVFVFDGATDELYSLTGDQPGSSDSLNIDVGYDGNVFSSNGVFTFETGKALVSGDTNNQTDVYSYDFGSGFALVSTKADGTGVGLASQEPSVSTDGRFVAFRTFSDALAPGGADGYPDVVVKDRWTGAVALVSTPASGTSNQGSGAPEISYGGDWVAFESSASNLAATDANGTANDVFRAANPLAVDTLTGRAGNDTYALAGGSHDQLVEAVGEGTDTAEVSGTYVLTAPNVENVVAPSGIVGADDFTGNSGNNRIDPGLGSDLMRGSVGNDTYVADVNTDNITGEAGLVGTDTVESAVTWTLGAGLENLTLTGSGANNASGNSAANVLIGNSANNILNGSSAADTYTGGGGADGFTASSISTFDLVTDFTPGTDKVRISQSSWHVGDSDLLVEGATTRTGPGGFSNVAELVIITKNLSSLTATNAAAAIGSATGTYAIGARRMFIVDNGTTSQLMLFTAVNTDAKVSSSEIRPMMTFKNRAALTTATVQFVG